MDEFWTNSKYFTGPPLRDGMVQEAEALLGYKLPASYIALLQSRNGGTPIRDCFPTTTPTLWAKDHIALSGIRGVGGEWGIDSASLGSIPMIQEWGYPNIGIVIGECPSAGHDAVMLDYSLCGASGEPRVVHVETECSPLQVTFLASNFQSFINGLVSSDVYAAEV
ncbi:SMI1/KNR4 family protein [Rhodanobacter sp. C05]|uniref:SMI1/KNR4 family protein n=1 Tax=Rhodanobacter sp. C05 TaxID=1945855 RepID=UPI0009850126|nr:SMI1/KNR4 family protein [Rhodanobacter sp. C05]OOG36230.1 hypothetical protein B0E51_17845 [Rhodanobacter sp. C05]